MEIKNGKTYVDAAGRKVRVICTDYKPANTVYTALGIVEDATGEMARAYRTDGTNDYAANLVKEYIPPIKVRLIVYSTGTGTHSCSSVEGSPYFTMTHHHLLGRGATVISDQIIEVEDTSK
jgi:hypothetical protein